MLKNDLHERTWFFDLEWVPDAAGAKRLYDLPDDTTELGAMEEIWKRASGFSVAVPRPFVKYLFSRVVSIAFLSRNAVFRDGEKRIDFALHSLPKLPVDPSESDEAYIIERFLHYIGERCPQLVGFNSIESDMQVLIQRGLVNEISSPAFCSRPDKPWEGRDYFARHENEWHLDLIKRFSNGAMTPRLNEIARLCGFPGKLDVDGEQVADLWLAGEITKIVEYNQIDTLNTYLIWLRFVYFAGKLSEEEYITEQDEFRGFLERESAKPEKDFLQKFLDKWEM